MRDSNLEILMFSESPTKRKVLYETVLCNQVQIHIHEKYV